MAKSKNVIVEDDEPQEEFEAKERTYTDLQCRLSELIATNQSLVLVRTDQPFDFIAELAELCDGDDYTWQVLVWDCDAGLRFADKNKETTEATSAAAPGVPTWQQPGKPPQGQPGGVPAALASITKAKGGQSLCAAIDTLSKANFTETNEQGIVSQVPTILVVKNIHRFWKGSESDATEVIQKLANVANVFKTEHKMVLGIAPPGELPPHELLPAVTIIKKGLPELAELVKVISAVSVNDFDARLTAEQIEMVAEVSRGLTSLQAENAAAVAGARLSVAAINEADLAKMEGRKPSKINYGEFYCNVVEEVKNEILNADGMLKRWNGKESFQDIGGNDAVKEYLKLVMRPEARKKKSKHNAILLVGPPGCLDGNTVVQYRRGVRNSSRDITLADLYLKFNGLPAGSRPWADLTEPTYLHSVGNDGVVFYNRVLGVYDSGEKPVVRLELYDGTVLRLTEDHPVATPDGDFVEAGSLLPGQAVLARGSMKPKEGVGKNLSQRPFRVLVNVKHHPYGASKVVAGHSYKIVPRARLVLEARLTGMAYADFVHCLKNDAPACKTFAYLPEDIEVHHIDEDTLNDNIDNLLPMSKADHARLHSQTGNFGVQYTKELCVTSVTPDGVAATYDVQMTSPANNFAANGVFVHNTGKTLLAKALGQFTGRKTYGGNLSSNKGKYVGESEANTRRMFERASAMNSIVLYFDEINEQVEGGESDGHSVDKALRQYLMEWLDTHHLSDDVYVVLTANDISQMHMALTRAGRVDDIWYVGLPGKTQKQSIWEICIQKYGLSEEQVEKLPSDEGWAGVEIDHCCKKADNFGITLIEAGRKIIPSSIRVAEQIERLKHWAHGRCLDAETGELFDPRKAAVPEATGQIPELGKRAVRKVRSTHIKK